MKTVSSADTVISSLHNSDSLKITKSAANSDTGIVVKFLKDSTATTVKGSLKNTNHVTVYIDIKRGKLLAAFLQASDPAANIRINQIITPDGKADGPFGKEISQPVIKKGQYKIIIGHDLMAEGLTDVNFALRIVVK